MNLNNILTFLISTSVITGAIIYIGKRIVDKSLDLALEKYKSSLDRELEAYKSQLDKVLYEHQIKFGKLHQDRLDVVKEFNFKLIDIQNSLEDLTTTYQGPDYTIDIVREKKATNDLDTLSVLLEINQIYFNESFCEKIRTIIAEGRIWVKEMQSIKSGEIEAVGKIKRNIPIPTEERMDLFHRWQALEKLVQVKIKEVRVEMIKDFRSLIGVE